MNRPRLQHSLHFCTSPHITSISGTMATSFGNKEDPLLNIEEAGLGTRASSAMPPPTDNSQDYHSLPESGIGVGVGLRSGNADDEPKDAATSSILPFEQEPNQFSQWSFVESTEPYLSAVTPTQTTIVQACYLAIAAILGTLLRMVLAQLFGEECRNPGTVGWLASAAPLCVTRSGDSDQVGGIIFADLPSNILGSFIMGLMQDGKSLDLAVHSPLAWLQPSNVLQGFGILHLAIKTGFCGSLTTFSSWNSEMVVMLVGEGATHKKSQFFKALFGYLIGVETALGSFVCGRTVAHWLHKWANTELAQEAAAARIRKQQGYAINPSLPPLERRFLPDLPLHLENQYPPSQIIVPGIAYLAQWRDSTKEARRLEHPAVNTLQELETAVFVNHQDINPEIESLCKQQGWDVSALKSYIVTQMPILESIPPTQNISASGVRQSEDHRLFFQLPFAITLLALILIALIFLLGVTASDEGYMITYRTMVYSMLFSAPGALLRWRLGTFNGKIPLERIAWIPAGTLSANILGSAISITMIALEYRLVENSSNYGFWRIATLRAVKIGFCGCLTTVSTFIAEVHSMTMQLKQDRAYKYITLSLVSSAVLAMTIFCAIVYTAPNY